MLHGLCDDVACDADLSSRPHMRDASEIKIYIATRGER